MIRDLMLRGFLLGASIALSAAFSPVPAHACLVKAPPEPLPIAPGGGCTPTWLPTFGGQPGTNGPIRAMTVFDDGGGEALYVGGTFSTAGGTLCDGVAQWDGSKWTTLGQDPDHFARIEALATFDDGNGTALYAGGSFTFMNGTPANNVAKWDGSSWTPLGLGTDGSVECLFEHDDGNGPALYAGGRFTNAGGVSANYIARWDGSNWTAVGGGMGDDVLALASYDGGSGPELYAGGRFLTADGNSANRLAKWNGTAWTPAGSGTSWEVSTLENFDDGTGNALYVGGGFASAGGIASPGIARWDGSNWSAVSGGIAQTNVRALAVYDDGTGPALYAAQVFGGQDTYFVTRWDGTSWASFAGGMVGLIQCLQVYDDGSGPTLCAGGSFDIAQNRSAHNVAAWDGSAWSPLGKGITDDVLALTVFDDGQGPALYASGNFDEAGGIDVNQIARRNGSDWTPLGTGIPGSVKALTVFDDGTGEALYAAGQFSSAGGFSARSIAKWNGSTWSGLGSLASNGVTNGNLGATVRALAVYDDGSGPALYVGGTFTVAGGLPVEKIAKWDGANWFDVGGGITGPSSSVWSLAVFNDGTGERLYVGGTFNSAGRIAASNIACWDGSDWSPLTTGTGTLVRSLIVHDDGSGPALYAGGGFDMAGGVPASGIARWNGTNWSALGTGLLYDNGFSTGAGYAAALGIFDDGDGAALYAGGQFTEAGGTLASRIAKWDGTQWSALGNGFAGPFSDVNSLLSHDDGSGPALYAGGSFQAAIDSEDSFLAKWGCTSVETFESFCNGDGGDQAGCTDCPCGNNAPQGTIGGCLNSDSSSAQLQAGGAPSVAADTLRINLSGGTANTFAILSSGASRAPANAVNPCFGLDAGIQSPTFDGLRCTVQSVLRHGTRLIDANGDVGLTTSGWGGSFGPPGGLIAQGGFTAGQTRHYQVVYREEATLGCMRGLNTTQGITVTFEP